MEKNAKESMLKILDYLIPIICIVAIAGASFYLYSVYKERGIADNEYAAIEEVAGITELPQNMEPEIADEEQEDDMDEYRQTFLNLHVDFKALEEINSDVIGWLYIPSLQLSYPVLQGVDNDYYLHHTMEGTANSSGSVFIDAQSNKNMEEFNTFFYGHAMKNGTMFGSLRELLKNHELIDNNPYIYYYTKDHAYKYRMIAAYITRQGSDTYVIPETREQFYNYMQKVSQWNTYKNGLEPIAYNENYGNVDWDNLTEEELENIDDLLTFSNIYKLGTGEEIAIDNIITLSTCSGSGTGQRKIVQAYLFDDYKILVEPF